MLVKSNKLNILRKSFVSVFIITCIFSAPYSALADDAVFEWVKGVGGVGSDFANSSILDTDSNIYTTGTFNGTVDFDPGAGIHNVTSVGTADIFITKFDFDGNFVWVKTMGGADGSSGKSIKLSNNGDIYVAGIFSGTVDFDPGAGIYNLTSAGSLDVFITKLDSSGGFIWTKAVGGVESEGPYSIAIDNNNNIYTTGYFYDTVDFDPGAGTYNMTTSGNADVFINKLDFDGNFVWAKSIGGSACDYPYTITLDSNDDIYTTGYFCAETGDFDPGPGTYNLTSAADYASFITKLDSDGDFIWAKAIEGPDYNYTSGGVVTDTDNNIYLAGGFTGTVDFDTGAGVSNLTSAGSEDTFITKLDSDGNFMWAKSMGGSGYDYPFSVTLDLNRNIYITGYFNGTSDFDPDAGISNITSAGSDDTFITKLDSGANFVWAKSIGGVGGDYSSSGFIVDANNNIYTAGSFQATADFDPGASTANLTSAGSDDIFLLKLSQILPPTITTLPPSGTRYDRTTLNGNITDTGGVDPTEVGFEYGIDNTYGTTVNESSGPYSTGTFSIDVTELDCDTEYHYRSYATNTEGASYGAETIFTTSSCQRSSGSSSSSSSSSYHAVVTPPLVVTPPTNTPVTPTPPITPSCTITVTLKQGNKGTQVKCLQTLLNINSDGIFGPKTKASVVSFQKSHGLTPDGVVGPRTRGELK